MQAYNIKNARKKILAGSFVVYLILAVSLGVSIAYWYILAGAGNTEDKTTFWTFIIWLVVAVGFVAEIVKKVTISMFRNMTIWSVATFVSILTVMGTYSILDQDKQSELTKQSDGYKIALSQKTEALKQQAKYAYAQSFNITDLEERKRKAGNKAHWGTYNSLKKDIEARKKYLSAVNTLSLSEQGVKVGGAGTVSSNPLLSNIAELLGISDELLKSLFYLLVTVLLEIAAFWIGGKVEELKNIIYLTEAEILDLKLKAFYGVTMAELNSGIFAGVVQAQINEIEAEKQIEQIRKVSRQKLPANEAVQQIEEIKNQSEKEKEKAKQQHTENATQPPRPTFAQIEPDFQPKDLNITPKTCPSFGFGFLSNIAPKKEQSAPKQGQGAERGAPKKGQLKSTPKVDITSGGAGGRRKKETPDTGTSGKNSNRYKALKKAIGTGEVRPSYRGIKAFKYGGRGMGASTVKIYMEALKEEGIIKA